MASYRDKLPASGAASVVSVQRSTVAASGTSTDITISAVDMSKTYIRHSARYADSATGRDACYNIELINSTTVRITRDATASISIYPLVSMEVVSDSGCTVQRGTSASATTITISSINQAKSFININGLRSSSAATPYVQQVLFGRITADTTINLQVGVSTGISNLKWEVVSYV